MTHDIANAWDTTKSREFNRTAFPWQVACDGHEIPMRLGAGEWALYCWNVKDKKHGYYLFEKDVFVDEYYFSIEALPSMNALLRQAEIEACLG